MMRPVHTHITRILLSLYFLEAAMLLVLVGLYKAPTYEWSLLSTKAGAVFIAGGIGLFASGLLLIWQIEAAGPLRGRVLALGATTNLLSVLLVFLILESSVRIAARKSSDGIFVGSVPIRPTWQELLARNRDVLAGIVLSRDPLTPSGSRSKSYLVLDQRLGWTVGSNRRSQDGLYFSSIEGIRSAGPNTRLASSPRRYRVALVGDSNAFSLEVPFEDSWGYHLQRLLGDDVQVLNFGVDGYGIDQMYLRYKQDVRPWKADVVVVGFISHDLWRTMSVYPFMSFGWQGFLAKPRFSISKGELELLNVPLPTPDEILGAGKPHELPFVEYDLGYRAMGWYWRFEHWPLVLRFLVSRFPRWRIADFRVSEEATKELNSQLFARLVKAIKQAGSAPLVFLLNEYEDTRVQETLARARVPHLGISGCLSELSADHRRVPSGNHYSGFGNEAIARCTAPEVERALRRGRVSGEDRSNRAPKFPSVTNPN